MANITKELLFSEGVTVSPPANTSSSAGSLVSYASDAAYVTAKGSAAVNGDIYYNTTDHIIRLYADDEWGEVSGGGAIPVAIDHTTTTLEMNRFYLIDMSGASGDVTFTFPDMAEGDQWRALVFGNDTNGHLATFKTTTPQNMYYRGDTDTTAQLAVPDTWLGGAWDSNNSYVAIYDASTFLSGNLAGDWNVEGGLTVDTDTLVVDATINNVGIGGIPTTPTNWIGNNYTEIIGTSMGGLVLNGARNSATYVASVIFSNAENANSTYNHVQSKNVAVIGSKAVTADANAGDDSGGSLIFSTKPDGGVLADRMTIDSDGNVGIGTASPDGLLTIPSANSTTPRIRFQHPSVTTDAAISTFQDAQGTNLYIGTNFYHDGTAFERFNASEESAGISLNRTGFVEFLTGAAGATAETRMTIDSGGNVGIGAAPGSIYDLDLNRSTESPGTGAATVRLLSKAGAGASMMFSDVTNSQRIGHLTTTNQFQVQSAGTGGVVLPGGATAWAALSDRREKKNIKDLNLGLKEILKLEPISFDYLEDSSEGSYRLGFIAQDVQKIVEYAVTYEKDIDRHFMSIESLVPVMTKAIQEQQTEIETLKTQLSDVLARLDNGGL